MENTNIAAATMPAANVANLAADASAPVTVVATVAKEKKVNPLNVARKAMLANCREERKTLKDCLRLIIMFGAAYLKEVRLTPSELLALQPADLSPHQKVSERFKAAIGADGAPKLEESGWSPMKVCKAIERRAVTLTPVVPTVTPTAPIIA